MCVNCGEYGLSKEDPFFAFVAEITSSPVPEKFREIYNFAFAWAKEKVNIFCGHKNPMLSIR